ncbi:MAG: hypothetical protein US24_C0005G0017 [candidate division WS6 bacterium GW2011_GWC2_36_7]|uniref:Uncharacterized protein n=1 Tax=candidate division WS6 bacterium GW2011_GWC2_36_7 TaxID=1619091 RepID=A0A0G0FF08_9BACT|nr:MAG: hypothetical protein US24_C0005G0017 [candidate division WS6 bacterium GW2011_GWC2_36_7]
MQSYNAHKWCIALNISFAYTFVMTYSKGIQNRIKRTEGQVGGVKKMIVEGETNIKVMTQLQACISSLESLKVEMIKQEMKQSLVEDVKKSLGLT